MKSKSYVWLALVAVIFMSAAVYAEDEKQPAPKTELQKQATIKADLSVTTERAIDQRLLNDLIILYPDNIKTPAACFQTAFSNYVEDQWNRIEKETGCGSEDKYCGPAGTTDPFTGGPIKERLQIIFGNVWVNAAAVGKFEKPLLEWLTPNSKLSAFSPSRNIPSDNIPLEELNVRLAEFNKYVTNCNALKPVAWSIMGVPFEDDDSHPGSLAVAGIKLAYYKGIIMHVLGTYLPDDQKGYVGCLATYLDTAEKIRSDAVCKKDKKCVETLPIDTKDALSRTLEDMKAHQCTAMYAHQMIGH